MMNYLPGDLQSMKPFRHASALVALASHSCPISGLSAFSSNHKTRRISDAKKNGDGCRDPDDQLQVFALAGADEPKTEKAAPKTILFLGDSITAAGGYVRIIDAELAKQVPSNACA